MGLLLSGLRWAAASFQVVDHPQRLTENVWKEFSKVFYLISIFQYLLDYQIKKFCSEAEKFKE